ncbi:hypothetical protein ANCCAN_13774 [Ancylostoma caninum]|uniref:Uncharacterized protein n=1 Tax=Ancylostoma caninum TaxID=29170 RepID=A0A368GBX6_ANCCA|nr:hypothetical protein ANCCAN_13774 [Ancylostoma caninum]
MTVCTFNALTLAPEASIEHLMMQARKIRYGVIGVTGTRRHRPLNATFDTEKELFVGTCGSWGVGGVGVLVNTNLVLNVDSFKQLTTRIERLRLRRCGSLSAFLEDAVVDNIDKDYDRLLQHLRDSAKKAEGSTATKRLLSYETLELIRQRGAARAVGNHQLTSELAKRCR